MWRSFPQRLLRATTTTSTQDGNELELSSYRRRKRVKNIVEAEEPMRMVGERVLINGLVMVQRGV